MPLAADVLLAAGTPAHDDRREGAASRPTIPAVLAFALGLWASCACVLLALAQAREADCIAWAVAGLAGCTCLLLLIVWRPNAAVLPLVALLGALAGLSLGAAHAAHMQDQMARLQDGVTGRFEFVVVEDPRAGDFGPSAIARTRVEGVGEVLVRTYLPAGEEVGCWQRFVATCTIESASGARSDTAWRKGCAGRATIGSLEHVRAGSLFATVGQMRQRALDAFAAHDTPGALLVESISLGSRQRLFESDLYGQVKVLGLAHIVAVSGAHLAILSSFLAMAGRALHMSRRMSALVQVLAIGTFLVLAGAPHSALRAALMASCAIGALLARRRGWAQSALGACIALLLLARPELALSVSFALSALATLSILMFSRYFAWWFKVAFAGRFGGLCDLLGMSVAAMLGTAPVAWSLFGQLPLLGPLASIAAIPACSVLCIGGLAAGLLAALAPSALSPAASAAVSLVVELGDAACRLVELAAGIPLACLGVSPPSALLALASLGLAVALYAAWPAPTRARFGLAAGFVAAALAAVVLVAPRLHGDELIMLDVGQGDSIVLRSGAQTVLIDTGNQDALVVKALARHDIREIDLLVVTHPDDDHCGSLQAVRDTTLVRRVGVAADLLDCPCDNCSGLRDRLDGLEVVPLHMQDTLGWGAYSATVVWPDRFHEEGGNQDSVVLEVQADCDRDGAADWTMLLTGDAEAETIEPLVRSGLVGAVDVLKVGHHGSRASLDASLAQALSPRLALVSAGLNNRYGHPAPEVLRLLEEEGTQIVRTDLQGDVSCKLHATGIEVEPLR